MKLNDRPPTMSISNYELGIVFPLRESVLRERVSQSARDNAKAAADAIAPYRRPSRPYNSSDLPWVSSDREYAQCTAKSRRTRR